MSVNGVADIIIVDDAQVDLDKPLNVNGTVTAPAFTANTGIFTGDGSGLTSLTGANVTGEVAFAAVANAVAGGNVSGQVANALVTATSQVAIASFAVSGINGIEFLVKGIDATSGNTSVASVLTVTDGSTVDFVTYGQTFLTGSPGVLAVGLNGSDLELLVTPTATDSTVWVTQYRFI